MLSEREDSQVTAGVNSCPAGDGAAGNVAWRGVKNGGGKRDHHIGAP